MGEYPEITRKGLMLSGAMHETIGALLGLMAAATIILLSRFLGYAETYLICLGVILVVRYLFTIAYAWMVRFHCTRGRGKEHGMEGYLLGDHRMLNAATAAFGTCLTAVTVVTMTGDSPGWMTEWWVLLLGSAILGSTVNKLLVIFTPALVYRRPR